MRFDILTLFPDFVDGILSESIIGRARKSGILDINAWNIRDWSEDKNRRVDDTPYGGGKGMLMAAPPVYACHAAVADLDPKKEMRTRTIYMSPKGKVLNQKRAEELSREYDRLIILCGHYEGIDQRVIDEIVDEEISIGDYVLTGGEIPACLLVDCVSRMIDGVLAAPECYESESIASGLLEYPQYTRPYEFHGVCVPDVLVSGHHAKIEEWRYREAWKITEERRPELLSGLISPDEKKKKSRKRTGKADDPEILMKSEEVLKENNKDIVKKERKEASD
ncbi:MAG: tRNA (guanosine(37)-N1)-methyltransferase TrmD [Clostridia bacterium]|nr:tRNA (guanosine(37)-N1)-methyltransferase TrmD [Clostridia bacterium]